MVDSIKPLVQCVKSCVNRYKLRVNCDEPSIDGDETGNPWRRIEHLRRRIGIHGDESSIYGVESGIHGDESSIYGVESRIHGDESSIYGVESGIHGDESSIYGVESGIHGDESSIYGVEPLVLRVESRMHLAKPAVDQLGVLAKVLFEGFAAHR